MAHLLHQPGFSFGGSQSEMEWPTGFVPKKRWKADSMERRDHVVVQAAELVGLVHTHNLCLKKRENRNYKSCCKGAGLGTR